MSNPPVARTLPRPATGYAAVRGRVADLLDQGRWRDAIAVLQALRPAFGTDPVYVFDLSLCHWGLDEAEIAIALMEIVVKVAPDRAEHWGRLGVMHLSLGQEEAARAALETGLRLAPKSAQMLAALDRVAPFPREGRKADQLRRIALSSRLPAVDKATALNTLGRIEERAGNPEAAFRHFARSKALIPGRYDPDAFDRHVAAQVARFSPPSDPGGAEGPRVVFVVGMPRSGTTLAESILDRHPEVAGIGESRALPRALALCRAERSGPAARTGWDWQDGLSGEARARYRRAYLDHALQKFPGEAPPVIIDKLPLNALELGFAAHILPGARFIHMSRHPLDMGLSNFATNFHDTHVFSKRLDWIGHLSRCVARSAADYAEKLGPAFRLQSYRALVEDTRTEVEALLDHLGLPWSEACLAPQESGRIVRTASVAQVRRAINRDGLGRWRAHADDLGPLVEALGGQGELDRWERADRSQTGGAKPP